MTPNKAFITISKCSHQCTKQQRNDGATLLAQPALCWRNKKQVTLD